MYTREHNDFCDGIPDNYNGIAMKGKHPERRLCDDKHECNDRCECNDKHECNDRCERDVCKSPVIEPKCQEKKGGGILSSLLGRLGLGGIDTTELAILFVALLLMSDGGCDDENYIWVILLLLLLIN